MNDNKHCATCKYFTQGVNCGYCANEKQTNDLLKSYTYYSYACELHEEGRDEIMKIKKPNIDC